MWHRSRPCHTIRSWTKQVMMFLTSQNLNEMPLKLLSVQLIATTTMKGCFSGKPTCHQKKKAVTYFFVGCWWFLSWRNTSRCREPVFVWALTAEAASEGKSKDTLKEVADVWCVRKPVTGHGSAQIADSSRVQTQSHFVNSNAQNMTEMARVEALWFPSSVPSWTHELRNKAALFYLSVASCLWLSLVFFLSLLTMAKNSMARAAEAIDTSIREEKGEDSGICSWTVLKRQ